MKIRALVVIAAVAAFAVPTLAYGDTGGVTELVPGTAVLLTQSTSTSGNGGNTSSTTSSTNIFSPAAYVDYKTFGGEPTTAVDHYPFVPGPYGFGATTTSYRDLVYVSNPLGVGYPGFSEFYKSNDGGQSFRLPQHDAIFGTPTGTQGGGGGDSHQAVGDVTHSIFFIDLSGGCVTMNVSRDLGETFTSDRLGCGLNEGAIDDRQWVATDETAPGSQGGNVYVNFNNDTTLVGATIALARSKHDGAPGTFATDSVCNLLTDASGVQINPAPSTTADDKTATPCPDPYDTQLWISGSVVVDKSATSPYQHSLYIPFERIVAGNYLLYVAISRDEGDSWTRHLVANLGPHDAANIFPQLTIDTGGNLYFDWAQTVGNNTAANGGGETDVYYTYSQGGGLDGTWAPPIDLTPEANDSAVFPWMVAGDPGQVDLVYYKANTGLNPNIAFYDSNGNPCNQGTAGCNPNTTVWNTYFAQSQNALNSGSNFKSVQISDHPIHIGGICTGGINCQGTEQANRNLLDFFTVDIDHLGAAYVTWADDNNSRHDTRQRFSRQLSGNSVFKSQTIAQQNAWPITDHRVTDQGGDVYNSDGVLTPCPSFDLLATSEQQNADNTTTVGLTLGAPPTAASAVTCSGFQATGGLWGVEFWSASTADPTTGGGPNDNFYVAYRDNVLGGPQAEAGRLNSIDVTLTADEFHMVEPATASTCVPVTTPITGFPEACTVTITASLTGLGIKPGAGMYSITGLTTYIFGSETGRPPFLRVALGDSQQADAATPFDDNGTGTIK